MFRLTSAQYEATIRSAFSRFRLGARTIVPPSYEAPFADANPADRYTTYARSYGMSDDDFGVAMAAGTDLARSFLEQLRRAGAHSHDEGCRLAEDRSDCVLGVVAQLGRVLFRRPMTTEELDSFALTYGEASSVSHDVGFETALRRLFAAPQFLYRDEVARTPERRLDAYQVAAALSYSLLDAPPDRDLAAAAERGALATEGELRSAALALLGEDLAEQPRVLGFLREYARMSGLELVFKDPSTARWYRPQYARETTDHFFRHLLRTYGREGFFEALLSDASVFVNRDTYRFYFPDDEASAARWGEQRDFERVELPETRRGLLTQPAWLVTHSHSEETHPVGRGHFIAESMLCVTIPPVPIGVVAALPDTPGATMRERLSEHSREECRGCHAFMDDVGLSLERFDHLGRSRETEHDRPIETAGTLRGGAEGDIPFSDTFAMIDALAASRSARECFVLQSFEYWLGRRPTEDDACTLVSMYDALHGERDYVEMLLVLFSSESFVAQQEASE